MQLILSALSVVLAGAIPMTGAGDWPPLPTSGFISGRIAKEADLQAGNAVFVAKFGGHVSGKPSNIRVPQYAILSEGDGSKLPVVVVQAEINEKGSFFGLRDLRGGNHVATATEVRLLGVATPRR